MSTNLEPLRVAVVAPVGSNVLELEVLLLKRERVQLVRFEDGAGLLGLLESNEAAPHLVFLEHRPIDALTLLNTLRQRKAGGVIPVVVLSQHWSQNDLAQARNQRANSSVGVPNDPIERLGLWQTLAVYWCDTNELPNP